MADEKTLQTDKNISIYFRITATDQEFWELFRTVLQMFENPEFREIPNFGESGIPEWR